jgi:hypothetical protein
MAPLWAPGGVGGVGVLRHTSGGLRLPWGLLGAGRGWGAGHVEEALVLLVGLVQHGRQARNMLSVVSLALLSRVAGSLEFVTQDLDLFA